MNKQQGCTQDRIIQLACQKVTLNLLRGRYAKKKLYPLKPFFGTESMMVMLFLRESRKGSKNDLKMSTLSTFLKIFRNEVHRPARIEGFSRLSFFFLNFLHIFFATNLSASSNIHSCGENDGSALLGQPCSIFNMLAANNSKL